ncbi:helix-turn-helix domain-containing protein [Actinomadura scrupuli]|uniref:helix-turn-helix domain-containing protein n=1 Tax=Actinomadura scrupuli TaxID=559629 RepID=UPI003D95B65D
MSTELGDYLRSCRARARPDQLGLPQGGRSRRVPGLRREELAHIAGVSVDYVARLEQGRVRSASAAVLGALARALNLQPDEYEYLMGCAHAAESGGPGAAGRPGRSPGGQVRPETQQLLDSMHLVPALVLGRRMEIVAWNALCAALIIDFGALPAADRNLLRLAFLTPSTRALYADWPKVARECVAYLRMDAGRYPDDPRLASLVEELSAKDPDFRRWWTDHQVRAPRFGHKEFLHPTAGPLTLAFQTLEMRDAPWQTMLVYTAEPGSHSFEALRFLARQAGVDQSAARV